jgi:hypothetical protein
LAGVQEKKRQYWGIGKASMGDVPCLYSHPGCRHVRTGSRSYQLPRLKEEILMRIVCCFFTWHIFVVAAVIILIALGVGATPKWKGPYKDYYKAIFFIGVGAAGIFVGFYPQFIANPTACLMEEYVPKGSELVSETDKYLQIRHEGNMYLLERTGSYKLLPQPASKENIQMISKEGEGRIGF